MRVFKKNIIKHNIEYLINFIENEGLFLEITRDYKDDRIKLLNDINIKEAQIDNFIKKYCNDEYSQLIYGRSYKRYFKNLDSRKEVNYKIKFNKYIYFEFYEFSKDVIDYILDKLTMNNEYEYLIFDIRNNAGGSVDECARLLREFIDNNELFTLKYKNKNITYKSRSSNYRFKKIYIFVSEGTVSSAEIFCYSMKYNLDNVVNIIGSTTGNKLIGQSLILINELKWIYSITTFRWVISNQSSEEFQKYLQKDSRFNCIDDYYKQILND